MTKIVEPTVKSTHDASASAGYVTPEGGEVDNANVNRKGTAKSKKQGMPNADTSAADTVTIAPAGQVTKEDLAMVFDGVELSEDAMTKALTLFEAAVSVKVEEISASLEEKYNTELAEAVDDLENKVSDYLEIFTEEYMTENELAIENGIKAEMAESLITSLRDIFMEHNVDIPDEKVDIVESLTSRIVELEEDLNESIKEKIESKKLIESYEKTKVLDELSEDLDDVSREKFKKLTEHVSFKDENSFKEKATLIKENISTKTAVTVVTLTETVDVPANVETETKTPTASRMSDYLKAMQTLGS